MEVGVAQTSVQILLRAKLYCFFLLAQLMLIAFLFIVPIFQSAVTGPK